MTLYNYGDTINQRSQVNGNQPAQKWLKDRKQGTLGYENILRYQKIIVALYKTDGIMKEIDSREIQ